LMEKIASTYKKLEQWKPNLPPTQISQLSPQLENAVATLPDVESLPLPGSAREKNSVDTIQQKFIPLNEVVGFVWTGFYEINVVIYLIFFVLPHLA